MTHLQERGVDVRCELKVVHFIQSNLNNYFGNNFVISSAVNSRIPLSSGFNPGTEDPNFRQITNIACICHLLKNQHGS